MSASYLLHQDLIDEPSSVLVDETEHHDPGILPPGQPDLCPVRFNSDVKRLHLIVFSLRQAQLDRCLTRRNRIALNMRPAALSVVRGHHRAQDDWIMAVCE